MQQIQISKCCGGISHRILPICIFFPPETQIKEMPNERMDLAEEVNGQVTTKKA